MSVQSFVTPWEKTLKIYLKFLNMQRSLQSCRQTGLYHHHSPEILDWPDFRRLISEEPHRRCFLDNFWLRGMRKILVGAKNRSNKSFAGDKLELLNSGGEESQLRPINNRRRPRREPPAWQRVNITLSVARRERGSLGNLIYLNTSPQPKCLTIFDEWKKKKKGMKKKWAVDLWDHKKKKM